MYSAYVISRAQKMDGKHECDHNFEHYRGFMMNNKIEGFFSGH